MILGLLALIGGANCRADDVFPDIPKRVLPTIQTLPTEGEIILDVRTAVPGDSTLPGEADTNKGYIDTVGMEIGVFNLANQTQAIWDLPHEIPRIVPIGSQSMRVSWAPKQGRLLLAVKDGAYLVDPAGHVQRITLRMPGIAVRYIDATEFSLSDDGALISFKLEGHDAGDKSPDVNDPYKVKLGKHYSELMYEETTGTAVPVTIAKSEFRFDGDGKVIFAQYVYLGALSPDRSKVAFQVGGERGSSLLEIADIADGVVKSVHVVDLPSMRGDSGIGNIRWSPDGQTLGLIVGTNWFEGSKRRNKSRLFTVNRNGQELREIRFAGKDINISAFAWSPAGDRFALRTDLQAKTLCNHNLSYYFDTGSWPCIESENLFVGNTDGSGLKKISREPEFRHGELFWIR